MQGNIQHVANQRLAYKNPRRAFTLIEMMAVMIIIAILFVLIIGTIEYAKRKALESRAAAEINRIHFVIQNWHMQNSTYPANLAAIVPLLPEGFTISNNVPCDPWYRPYIYSRNGQAYRLYSTGHNATNAADDIETGN